MAGGQAAARCLTAKTYYLLSLMIQTQGEMNKPIVDQTLQQELRCQFFLVEIPQISEGFFSESFPVVLGEVVVLESSHLCLSIWYSELAQKLYNPDMMTLLPLVPSVLSV